MVYTARARRALSALTEGRAASAPFFVPRQCRDTTEPHAQANRHQIDPDHRRRSDRHRTGLRVRLFRHPGLQGAQGGRLPDRPGQLEPGDDHDRPGRRRRDLYRADHAGDRRQDHREGAARRAAADHGRADRAQHRAVAAPHGRARKIRRDDDRRRCRRHRQGRGPRAVPRGDEEDRPRDAEVGARERHRPQAAGPRAARRRDREDQGQRPCQGRRARRARGVRNAMAGARGRPQEALHRAGTDRGAAGAAGDRPAGDHPALVHARRHRRRHRLHARGVSRHRRARARRLPHHRSADRGIGAGLEGIRDGGRSRQERQLHHHLLDRESRSDGRPHRRLDHDRAGADAHRQGIPDHARRLDRGAARDRGRDRRLERAVRGQSGRRTSRHHRDEPAGVALLGAGLEGDRLPDRQGRGEARGRLHARRDRQRHHRRDHAGVVRADHRLRRHQDPALRVREIPRRRADADHLDEIGRRGHGDRPHLPGEHPEGAALAGNRPHRLRRDRDRGHRPGRSREPQRDARRARHADARPPPQGRAGDAPRLGRRPDLRRLQDRSVVPLADPRHRRQGGRDQGQGPAAERARDAAAQGDGLLRRPARQARRACRPMR